jgi:hypothetical protein
LPSAEPEAAHREGHRPARAKGSQPHDRIGDAEDQRGAFDQGPKRRALLADLRQNRTAQHRDQHHLQDLAIGKGTDEAVGDDVGEETDQPLMLGRLAA